MLLVGFREQHLRMKESIRAKSENWYTGKNLKVVENA
jgi:hypothetical protein